MANVIYVSNIEIGHSQGKDKIFSPCIISDIEKTEKADARRSMNWP